jgi:hypothetical protein
MISLSNSSYVWMGIVKFADDSKVFRRFAGSEGKEKNNHTRPQRVSVMVNYFCFCKVPGLSSRQAPPGVPPIARETFGSALSSETPSGKLKRSGPEVWAYPRRLAYLAYKQKVAAQLNGHLYAELLSERRSARRG